MSLDLNYLAQGQHVVGVPAATWTSNTACSVKALGLHATVEALQTGLCQIKINVPGARGGKGLEGVYTVRVE